MVSRLIASDKGENRSSRNIMTRFTLRLITMTENRMVVARAKGSAARDDGPVQNM
jgi:hypothetical protein